MKETVVAQEEKEEEEVGIYTPFPFPLKKYVVSCKKNLHDLDNEKNLGKNQMNFWWTSK